MHYTIITLIIIGFSARLLPHPPNFAPIAAIALFGGLYLPKRAAIAAPLAAMFLSDLIIGPYSWPIMVAVYLSFGVIGLIGIFIRKQKTFTKIIIGTLLGSLIFFLITNWAVWAFGNMYPPTISGLGQSYLMAIPFLRNSLLGDLFYVALLVGGQEVLLKIKSRLVAAPTP